MEAQACQALAMHVGQCGEGPRHLVPAQTVSRLRSEPEPHSRGRHMAGALNDSRVRSRHHRAAPGMPIVCPTLT